MTSDLNVYGQDGWHDPAYIVGTKAGFLNLLIAIEKAIELEEDVKVSFYASDGEGYDLTVRVRSEEEFNRYQAPYSGDIACSSYGTSPITDRKPLLTET